MSKITLDDDDMRQIVQQVVSAVTTLTERRIATAVNERAKPPELPPMPERKDPTPKSPADKKWGYVFGVDGVVSLETARIYLGNAARSTLDRYAEEDKIRRGKLGSKVVFCVRSIRDFAQSLES